MGSRNIWSLYNQETKRVILEQLQLAFYSTMQADYQSIGENARLDILEMKDVHDKILVYVRSWILDGHKIDRLESESIDFPATPWDFVKLKYAPKWFLERWPVKYKTTMVTKNIHQHYVCPHINMRDDRNPHIAWMYEQSGQKETNEHGRGRN